MKFKVDRQLAIKIGIVVLLVIAIPLLPELLLFVDAAGLDLAIAFFMLYLANGLGSAKLQLQNFKFELIASAKIISNTYMFKPQIYGAHALASSFVAILTGPIFLSVLVWFPAMTLSTGVLESFT